MSDKDSHVCLRCEDGRGGSCADSTNESACEVELCLFQRVYEDFAGCRAAADDVGESDDWAESVESRGGSKPERDCFGAWQKFEAAVGCWIRGRLLR